MYCEYIIAFNGFNSKQIDLLMIDFNQNLYFFSNVNHPPHRSILHLLRRWELGLRLSIFDSSQLTNSEIYRHVAHRIRHHYRFRCNWSCHSSYPSFSSSFYLSCPIYLFCPFLQPLLIDRYSTPTFKFLRLAFISFSPPFFLFLIFVAFAIAFASKSTFLTFPSTFNVTVVAILIASKLTFRPPFAFRSIILVFCFYPMTGSACPKQYLVD